MHAFFENIKLDELKVGNYEYDFELSDEWLKTVEKTELLSIKAQVHAALTLREDDYRLDVQVKGQVQLVCDRCLDPMDVDVDVEEDDVETEDAKQLNLAWIAYELIVTDLPMIHVHEEGQCNPEMEKLLKTYKS